MPGRSLHYNRSTRHQWLILVLLVTTVGGCANTYGVRTVRTDTLFHNMRDNVLFSGSLSRRTRQLLYRYDLLNEYHRSPETVLKQLDRKIRDNPTPEEVFALSELYYLGAKRTRVRNPERALAFYLGSAAHAYYYLFDPAVGRPENAFDPQFRLACDLYNRSLTEIIRLAQKKEEIRLNDTLQCRVGDDIVELKIDRYGFHWNPEEFGTYKFADDYEVLGLENHYRTYGLGVPLIAIRDRDTKDMAAKKGHLCNDHYFMRETSFPATAFLRMKGSICERSVSCRHATLELYDPLHVQSITVADRTVPLESDLTTPLGYFLSRSNHAKWELMGLLRPEQLQDKIGLYMVQPYEPGKIPVVMVHGLWSSPMTWMQMFNDLRADPNLRDRYQFWFFLYPTGNPIPYSASELRVALEQARKTFDPEHKDAAFDDMVLVGHSMGGLLSKMMVQESDSELWHLVSKKPIDKLDLSPDERSKLQGMFFFEPLPYVKRIVFIAVPHRGSDLSQRPIGRLASKLISLPKAFMESQQGLVAKNPDAFTSEFATQLPTSVDNLSPDSPIIQTVAKLPLERHIKYHTVVGVISGDAPQESTDGVVPYVSSHLDGALSECFVPAGHSTCQAHPLTVLEVQRILMEHLEDAPQMDEVQLIDDLDLDAALRDTPNEESQRPFRSGGRAPAGEKSGSSIPWAPSKRSPAGNPEMDVPPSPPGRRILAPSRLPELERLPATPAELNELGRELGLDTDQTSRHSGSALAADAGGTGPATETPAENPADNLAESTVSAPILLPLPQSTPDGTREGSAPLRTPNRAAGGPQTYAN